MKLIDFLIVKDAICHCDEAESLLHDRCEVRWCSESGRAGQGTRKLDPDLSPIVPALIATNKQTQVSLFNQIVSIYINITIAE